MIQKASRVLLDLKKKERDRKKAALQCAYVITDNCPATLR